jgi:hypothetical protein
MSVFAGSGQEGIADGVGTSASFECPCGITVDQQTGNLFVSDANIIRKITSKGLLPHIVIFLYFFCLSLVRNDKISMLNCGDNGNNFKIVNSFVN